MSQWDNRTKMIKILIISAINTAILRCSIKKVRRKWVLKIRRKIASKIYVPKSKIQTIPSPLIYLIYHLTPQSWELSKNPHNLLHPIMILQSSTLRSTFKKKNRLLRKLMRKARKKYLWYSAFRIQMRKMKRIVNHHHTLTNNQSLFSRKYKHYNLIMYKDQQKI